MTTRNLSPQQMFIDLVKEHRPECQFSGKDQSDFSDWKRSTLPKVLATIGNPPPSVDANPEMIAEWEDKGLIKQRWIIDVQRHLSATMLVNLPANLGRKPKNDLPVFCAAMATAHTVKNR